MAAEESQPRLEGVRVGVFATDGFEESELREPVRALREVGADVEIISLQKRKIQGFKHHDKSFQVDAGLALQDAKADNYAALVLPGGALNADATRTDPSVHAFIRAFEEAGKPIGIICHAPWLLVSAGLVRGRTLTSYKTIQDDIRNAGGNWVDQEVVVDGNWVTSRQPSDLPAFNRELIRLIAAWAGKASGKAA